MNKNKILIIFLLVFFFISLSSVSAMDDSNKAILTNNNQVIVSEGSSIQSAIDNATVGSTIIVERGSYSEDIVISKEISIIGKNAILKSNNTAFTILSTANNTSISGFNIFVSNGNGTGIVVNASNCKITDNKISGGNIGIFADAYISNSSGKIKIDIINNIMIVRNHISNIGEAGISIKAFNPIVSQNNITNIINNKENGTSKAIYVNAIGLVSRDLKVIVANNYVSNIKSFNDSAYGLDIGANSILDSLVEFNVSGNIIKNVISPVESYGMNVAIFALNNTLANINISNLNISYISTENHENSSVTGLGISITAIGQNETSNTVIEMFI